MKLPIDKIAEMYNNMYFGFGYDASVSPTSQTTPSESAYLTTEFNTCLIASFPINPTIDIKPIVTQQLWTRNQIHNCYNPYSPTTKIHYKTDTGDVYICIDNNNSNITGSTIKPTGQSSQNIILNDGYVWRYMYTATDDSVPAASLINPAGPTSIAPTGRAMSKVTINVNSNTAISSPIAVVYDPAQGTGATFQVVTDSMTDIVTKINVQAGGTGYRSPVIAVSDTFAGTGAILNLSIIDGHINVVSFTGGSGYNSNSPIVVIGSGTGCVLTPRFVAGVLVDVQVTNAGSGYTWVQSYVFTSNNYVLATSVFEPDNGFGYDMIRDLVVDTVRFKKTVASTALPLSTINQMSVLEKINKGYRFYHMTLIPTTNLLTTDSLTFQVETTIDV